VGITGVAYTFGAMALRYVTGAYTTTTTNTASLVTSLALHLQPKFGTKGAASIWHPNAFLLLSMLSTAYLSHYNAPRFYLELANPTIPRFSTVVVGSFATALCIFLGIAAVGFLTFGENSAGFILNNYAKNDSWMSWSRLAVALSILFS
jgi:amino acid permease